MFGDLYTIRVEMDDGNVIEGTARFTHSGEVHEMEEFLEGLLEEGHVNVWDIVRVDDEANITTDAEQTIKTFSASMDLD